MFSYFTIGNLVALGFLVFIAIVVTIFAFCYWKDFNETKEGVIAAVISFVISALIILGIAFTIKWYNTNTASGVRAIKDTQSELQNGIEREITITAEDGRQIFYYEGKVDIESNHEDNYIKFESDDGKRYIIYYGIQDTITIIEK